MATGHIRRMAAVNHERTFSGVSRLMYACTYTFIHSHRQAFFAFARIVWQPCELSVPDRGGRQPYYAVEPVVGLWGILWKFKKSSRTWSGTRATSTHAKVACETMSHSWPTHALF
jgi:hypothetical protein